MRVQGPGQSALLLLDVAEVLTELSVPDAVIGARAATCYGTVRAGVDADAVIGLNPRDRNLQPLLARLGRLGLNAAHVRSADGNGRRRNAC